MWKSLTVSKDESPYYINVEELKEKAFNKITYYKVSITNFITLWSAVFDSNDIVITMLNCNKSRRTEADLPQFLKAGLDILNNPKKMHMIEVIESPRSNLDISFTQVEGIVFNMDITLNLCTPEQFFSDVTRPLLQIIEDQHKSETELRKQMAGIRGYLSKIPKEILMRYEKQEIEDYNDVKHMQAHSVMETVFGSDTEDGVDLKHILNTRPSLKRLLTKEKPSSTRAESSSASSANPSLPACATKKEPESQPTESTNETIPNLGTIGIKPIEETNKESKIASSSLNNEPLIKTEEGTSLKSESESQLQNQRTPPKKRLNDQEVKTEVNDSVLQSEPSVSQRHGVLTPKKMRKNLNY